MKKASAQEPGSPAAALERQRILIVDDRKENLVALRQVLRELGAEIVEATSGNKALAATLDHDFAVAILDVMMPGMSGYELAEHLRGDQKTGAMPIVFVTASYADEQHMFKAALMQDHGLGLGLVQGELAALYPVAGGKTAVHALVCAQVGQVERGVDLGDAAEALQGYLPGPCRHLGQEGLGSGRQQGSQVKDVDAVPGQGGAYLVGG